MNIVVSNGASEIHDDFSKYVFFLPFAGLCAADVISLTPRGTQMEEPQLTKIVKGGRSTEAQGSEVATPSTLGKGTL